ncbi:MAG TPA: ribose 5-phosphate isomerase B [Bacteroidota bacterium]
MPRKVITEQDIVELAKKGEKVLRIDSDTILTPSAKDAALLHKIRITSLHEPSPHTNKGVDSVTVVEPKSKNASTNATMVALGSDHGGFRLKEALKQYLGELGYTVADVGTNSEEACDYPDFAYAVATMVASGRASKGIMIDGVGVASAIVANKVPGVRAVPCYDEFVARSSREHNDANVLTLGGRIVGSELAKSIVKIWLETWFGGGRHQARVDKIRDVEQRYSGHK